LKYHTFGEVDRVLWIGDLLKENICQIDVLADPRTTLPCHHKREERGCPLADLLPIPMLISKKKFTVSKANMLPTFTWHHRVLNRRLLDVIQNFPIYIYG
jgi:hypothetical protein